MGGQLCEWLAKCAFQESGSPVPQSIASMRGLPSQTALRFGWLYEVADAIA
jgi:hypothetical protein